MNPVSRKATAADFQAIYDIFMDPEANPYLNAEFSDKVGFRPIFETLLQRGNLWVYEYQGEVIGFYEIRRGQRRTAHTARLENIALKSEFAGQGFGSRLMAELLDTLRQEGIKRFDLLVEIDNPRAIHFYKKFGFDIEGTLRNYFKRANQADYVDDYLMAIIFN